MVRGHVAADADAEQKRALGAVGVLMQLARRMQDEGAGHHVDGAVGEIKAVADAQGALARRLESEIQALRVQAADLQQELEKFKVAQ